MHLVLAAKFLSTDLWVMVLHHSYSFNVHDFPAIAVVSFLMVEVNLCPPFFYFIDWLLRFGERTVEKKKVSFFQGTNILEME